MSYYTHPAYAQDRASYGAYLGPLPLSCQGDTATGKWIFTQIEEECQNS